MKCPYCGEEMILGEISTRNRLYVGTDLPDTEFPLIPFSIVRTILGYYTTPCYACEFCKAAIIPPESER